MKEEYYKDILDSLSETGIYVITEDTHQILYYNNKVKQVAPNVKLGMKCDEVWNPKTCVNCPLQTIGKKQSERVINYNDPFGQMVDLMASRMLWKNEIPAFVISVIPHMLNPHEEKGLEQIGKLYSKSMEAIFQECIIVNLSQDFYINVYMDGIWKEFPVRGKFSTDNLRYARKLMHREDYYKYEHSFSRKHLLSQFKNGKRQAVEKIRRRMEDGTYQWVEFFSSPIKDYEDGDIWCVLVYRNIHQEYLAEQKFSVEVNQLAVASRIAYEMLISVNLTQNTFSTLEHDNFVVERVGMSGCFDNLLEGAISFTHPSQRPEFLKKFNRQALQKAFENKGTHVSMEVCQERADGKYHWYTAQVVKVNNPYNDDVLGIIMSRNIDEEYEKRERELEKERRTKELLETALQKAKAASLAKSEFLSRMSHDIRTPLNAISGMLFIAQNNMGDEEKVKNCLLNIENSSKHLLELVNEVLDMSMIESGKVEMEEIEFDISEALESILLLVQPLVQEKGQELQFEFRNRGHQIVISNELHLKQIIINILSNAIKYTPNGGKIVFLAEVLNVEIRNYIQFRFSIADDGIGIEKEYLEHIFEPFSRAEDSRTSKSKGAGLGMAIVQNFVQLMGGDIQIESELGKGSCFTVSLYLKIPEEKDTMGPIDMRQPQSVVDFSGIHVLLAEDNDINRMISEELFSVLGVSVVTVENGEEAVMAFKEAAPGTYQAIFLDIQMPILNGWEASKQIRALEREDTKRIPIIAMTANAFSEDRKKSRMAGMNEHIAKPIDIEKLRQVLTKWVAYKLEPL